MEHAVPCNDEFRDEVRRILAGLGLPAASENRAVSRTAGFADGDDFVAASRAWQRTLADAGLAAITWPVEYGGRTASPTMSATLREELDHYEVPAPISEIGIEMIAPAILEHGSQEQKDRFLPPMRDGSEVWCQLWSEPSAGSDLASLRSKAEVERTASGDVFRINGQKVWTSGAHYAKWGQGLFRSNTEYSGSRGISCVIVDMEAPGVSIRPLRQMTGQSHFSEVFFDDVLVPVENLLGELHGGWSVARTTMGAERQTVASMTTSSHAIASLFGLLALGAGEGATARDAVLRDEVMRIYSNYRVLGMMIDQYRTRLEQGTSLVGESSVIKLLGAQLETGVANLGFALGGSGAGISSTDGLESGRWSEAVLASFAHHLGGGTDEIQRNIVGEALLGLPREPRAL